MVTCENAGNDRCHGCGKRVKGDRGEWLELMQRMPPQLGPLKRKGVNYVYVHRGVRDCWFAASQRLSEELKHPKALIASCTRLVTAKHGPHKEARVASTLAPGGYSHPRRVRVLITASGRVGILQGGQLVKTGKLSGDALVRFQAKAEAKGYEIITGKVARVKLRKYSHA